MLNTLKKLYAVNILSPSGFYKLVRSFYYSGINPMALLRFAAQLYPENFALTDDYETLAYKDLFVQSQRLASVFREEFNITANKKVAIVCRNHASFVRALFSVAGSGADIYLLNLEMSGTQFNVLAAGHNFDLVIYDTEVSGLIKNSGYQGTCILSYHESEPSIDSLCKSRSLYRDGRGKKVKAGKIYVLSGGTTGEFKTVGRRPDIRNFLSPFCSLLVNANLDEYKSVYIATPIYHGYGLAALFISILLGSEIFFLQRFEAAGACHLIRQHKIEVVTLVPLMLQRMINSDSSALQCLSCIISGGAHLNPALVKQTIEMLGLKLFNLYGTSEAGISVLATPEDLNFAANTIGKELAGVELNILGRDNNKVTVGAVGRICIKNKWAVKQGAKLWVETGDLGYKDGSGYYYLCGRSDDMIISGGENVYPVSLENILLRHEAVKEVAVIGVSDVEFGQRLKAFIVLKADCALTNDDILIWLKQRAARYEAPVSIEKLDELPYSALGKPDKKWLKADQAAPGKI